MQKQESVPVISIVMPVYNVANYLPKCLDSILSQTFEEIEVICIDDGSLDESPMILESYADRDNRIHVLYQQHQYAGVARNLGLDIAQGEYIIFLDSDDFFEFDMLENAYQSAQEYQSDIVLFNGYRYDDKKQTVVQKGGFLHTEYLPDKSVFSWADIPDFIFDITNPAPWTKLYSRHFLLENGLKFKTERNSNDSFFTLLSLALAKRISTVDENLVYYRINRENSLQNTKDISPLCFLISTQDLYNELVNRGLFNSLQTSFRHRTLDIIMYYLKGVKTDQARLQILDALDREPYCNLPLTEIPGIDDNNDLVHKCYLQFTAAQTQYHQSLRIRYAKKQYDALTIEQSIDSSIRVSIIIPVYNTEAYLDESLASIAGQTLKDIEIICINDGSTDGSLDILNRWAANDERIIVINQSNFGLGYARNIGIAHAHGEYLYMMDSDDLLQNDALEQLVTIMDEKHLESLYFDADTFFESKEIEIEYERFKNNYTRSRSYNDVYDGPTLMRLLSEEDKYIASACMQIQRLSFIRENGLAFQIGILHEDNAFTFSALLYAKRVSHIQYPYFKRRIRSDSIMTSSPSFKNVYGYYKTFCEMLHTYFETSSNINLENSTMALIRIRAMLNLARTNYAKVSDGEKCGEYGMLESTVMFRALVKNAATDTESIKKLKREKTDLNSKLQQTYTEKSEINAKLQQTYAEKSEINAKLQQTYKEKAERGVRIKELESQVKEYEQGNKHGTRIKELESQVKELEQQSKFAQQELDATRASFSFRLGHALTRPARWLRSKLCS